MKILQAFLLALALPQVISAKQVPKQKRQINVSTWLNNQVPKSWGALFRNVGSAGEFARDASPGAVIASPSTAGPDYYFQWIRDSALVMKVILNRFMNGDPTMESHLQNYIIESTKLQHTDNPSGGYYTGGLGEPKFRVNGAAFTGNWGRPQLDGPPLRAMVLTEYANILLDNNQTSYVVENLYAPVMPYNTTIKADLEFTSHNWQRSGFDLWEEVNARHFFTLMVSRRALLAGAELADRLADTSAATWYRQQASDIATALQPFWSSSKNYLLAYVNDNTGRSGLDCGTLLGALHGNGARGWGLFDASSDEVLATLDALVNVMGPLYPINANGEPGVAIGRYSEDVYDGAGTSGANPWFLCTFTTAEIAYTAVAKYRATGSLTVGSKSLSFFKRFLASAASGTQYASGSAGFAAVVDGMVQWADNQVARAAYHAATNGSLSEQYSRYNGYMTGARDLTWSYASFLTTAWAKEGKVAF